MKPTCLTTEGRNCYHLGQLVSARFLHCMVTLAKYQLLTPSVTGIEPFRFVSLKVGDSKEFVDT